MRSTMLTGLAAAAMIMTAVPSEAAWNGYSIESWNSPFRPRRAQDRKRNLQRNARGTAQCDCLPVGEDNIQYKVIVVDFSDRPNDEAALLAEAATAFKGQKGVGRLLARCR